jgi:hypothetical protein
MTPEEYAKLTTEQIEAYDLFGWPRESDEMDDYPKRRASMTQARLKELVDKLEGITNGGENLLTQDDYGDIYTILFDQWEKHEKPSDFS